MRSLFDNAETKHSEPNNRHLSHENPTFFEVSHTETTGSCDAVSLEIKE